MVFEETTKRFQGIIQTQYAEMSELLRDTIRKLTWSDNYYDRLTYSRETTVSWN